MTMNQIVIIIALFVFYLALGYLLSYLARDELKQGRKWFMALTIVGLVAGIIFIIFGEKNIGINCLGIALTGFVSYTKQ